MRKPLLNQDHILQPILVLYLVKKSFIASRYLSGRYHKGDLYIYSILIITIYINKILIRCTRNLASDLRMRVGGCLSV